MKSVLENDRIFLREFTLDDFDNLASILQDKETMYAYESAYSDEKVSNWLSWCMDSYQKHGFGLWAIIDKQTQNFVGQCGIVYSDIQGKDYLEIGYLLNKHYWSQGYASEAALLCKQYAKEVLQAPCVHSIIRDTNLPSQKVAKKMGMSIAFSYDKDYSGTPVCHHVFRVNL